MLFSHDFLVGLIVFFIGYPHLLQAQRNHIEIYRLRKGSELHASGLMTEGASLWAATDQLRVLFRDGHMIDIILEETGRHYEIHINDHLAYSCRYIGTIDEGVLLNIIKENDAMKIAPSPRSLCTPEFEYRNRPKKNLRKRPLHVLLMRRRSERSRGRI